MQPESMDRDLIELLVQRDGARTTVVLSNGRTLDVRNIAWGYDTGDACAHVTTNISPATVSASVDCFHTRDVRAVLDQHGSFILER
jgi:hypothetical protein